MTVQTLQQAIAKEEGSSPVDEESWVDREKLASVCAGLVGINEDSQIIGFVHTTVVEYLDNAFDDLYPKARRIINYCCFHHTLQYGYLSYFIQDDMTVGGNQWWYYELEESRRRLREHREEEYRNKPFWNYALFHMTLLEGGERSNLTEDARQKLKRLSGLSPKFDHSQEMEREFVLLFQNYSADDDYRKSLRTDLIFAVYTRDEIECRRILGDSTIPTSDSTLLDCLAFAASEESEGVVQLLLDAGADAGALVKVETDKTTLGYGNSLEKAAAEKNSPLGLAVGTGSISIVKRILDQRDDFINLPAKEDRSGKQTTALEWALYNKQYLSYNKQDKDKCSALVELLISHGAVDDKRGAQGVHG